MLSAYIKHSVNKNGFSYNLDFPPPILYFILALILSVDLFLVSLKWSVCGSINASLFSLENR